MGRAVIIHHACISRQVEELMDAMKSQMIEKVIEREEPKKNSYEKNFFRGKTYKGKTK